MNGSIAILHPSKASINGLDAIKVLMELGLLDTSYAVTRWLGVSNVFYFSIYIYIGNNHPNWYFSSLSPSPFLLTSCGPKKRSSILSGHKNSRCLHQGEPNNFNNVAEKARSMTSHTSVSRQLGWNTRAVEKDNMVWLVNLVAYVDGAPSNLSLWSYGRTSYHIAYIYNVAYIIYHSSYLVSYHIISFVVWFICMSEKVLSKVDAFVWCY